MATVYDINIKKLDEKAVIPTYGSEYAAGADLYACLDEAITIEPGQTVMDYRGEIMVALHNHGTQAQTVEPEERIAQLVIAPYIVGAFHQVDELSDTVRGAGGFGSTGK